MNASQTPSSVTSQHAMSMPEDEKPPKDASEFSLRAVLALIAAFFAYFCSVGLANAFGVFQEYYHSGPLREKTDFDISWIGSFATFATFAFAAPAGIIADKFNPQLAVGFGSICITVALMMVSLCTEFYQFFLAQGVLLGVGMSFVAIPPTATMPKYFKKHRGIASGITISGSSLGGVIWPIMFDRLLNHNQVSFGWTVRSMAFVCLPLLMVSTLCVRNPDQPTRSHGSIEASATASEEMQENSGVDSASAKTTKDVVTNPTFLLLCAGLALAYFGMFAPFFFTATYAVEKVGMETSLAFYTISLLSAASLFGRIGTGLVADRYGHFNILFFATFSAAAVAMCWTTATTVAGLVVWSLAYGFASGGMMSSQVACAAQLSTPSTHGAVVGLAMASVSITNLVGSPIGGQLIQHGFLSVSMYAGAMLLSGSAFMLAARLRVSRKLFDCA